MSAGPYPHPEKGAAWRENRNLCERIFFAGRTVATPAKSQDLVRAIRFNPEENPKCEQYRERLLGWLRLREREERAV